MINMLRIISNYIIVMTRKPVLETPLSAGPSHILSPYIVDGFMDNFLEKLAINLEKNKLRHFSYL